MLLIVLNKVLFPWKLKRRVGLEYYEKKEDAQCRNPSQLLQHDLQNSWYWLLSPSPIILEPWVDFSVTHLVLFPQWQKITATPVTVQRYFYFFITLVATWKICQNLFCFVLSVQDEMLTDISLWNNLYARKISNMVTTTQTFIIDLNLFSSST